MTRDYFELMRKYNAGYILGINEEEREFIEALNESIRYIEKLREEFLLFAKGLTTTNVQTIYPDRLPNTINSAIVYNKKKFFKVIEQITGKVLDNMTMEDVKEALPLIKTFNERRKFLIEKEPFILNEILNIGVVFDKKDVNEYDEVLALSVIDEFLEFCKCCSVVYKEKIFSQLNEDVFKYIHRIYQNPSDEVELELISKINAIIK